ncbi:YfiR family protein [bacterium]|nr:YfiR family protein [bacterium]
MKQKRTFLIVSFMLMIMVLQLHAQATDAPANVAAALLVKVAIYEKTISGSAQDVSIYVLGDAAVAAELRKGVGKPIGKATLKSVESGDGLPAVKPNILFITDPSKLTEALEYTQSNDILSATNKPDLVARGVTLGIGIAGGKPRILLNLSSSVEENLDWNAAIMKVAKTIK